VLIISGNTFHAEQLLRVDFKSSSHKKIHNISWIYTIYHGSFKKWFNDLQNYGKYEVKNDN
jgi:hypothetical protein